MVLITGAGSGIGPAIVERFLVEGASVVVLEINPVKAKDLQDDFGDAVNVTVGDGQATWPIVAAVSRTAPVSYAEILSSTASRSAGPGTRANIDVALDLVGAGAEQGPT